MADDPRLAVMIQAELDWISSDTAPKGRENRMLAILAALDAHAAKAPEGTVPVRIAVAFDKYGEAYAQQIFRPGEEEDAWNELQGFHEAGRRAGIITADVPLPVVAEIEGRVE